MAWDDIPDWATTVSNALLQALKERDPYTYGHCLRVARNARLLAKAAGLSEHEQTVIEYSSMFHDLGKIGISDQVLLKTSRLTPREYKIIQQHPLKSVEIIKPLAILPFF